MIFRGNKIFPSSFLPYLLHYSDDTFFNIAMKGRNELKNQFKGRRREETWQFCMEKISVQIPDFIARETNVHRKLSTIWHGK